MLQSVQSPTHLSQTTLSQPFRIKCERYIFLKKCVRSLLFLILFPHVYVYVSRLCDRNIWIGWLVVWVLWHVNLWWLFNAKSSLSLSLSIYIYIYLLPMNTSVKFSMSRVSLVRTWLISFNLLFFFTTLFLARRTERHQFWCFRTILLN